MFNRRKFIQTVSVATASATYLAGDTQAHSLTSQGVGTFVAKDQFKSQLEDGSEFAIQIKVIGVGGGGNQAVESMAGNCLMTGNWPGVELICADTDASALAAGIAHRFIQLGIDTWGPARTTEEGRWSADHVAQDIRTTINGAHMLFIPVVLGGSTGTGAASVIARLARKMGILTVVAAITQPFGVDEARSMSGADTNASLAELEASADAVIVMHYAKLLDVLGRNTAPNQVLAHANCMLANLVRDTALAVNVPCRVGVDFEDVRTVLGQPGKALIGSALASGSARASIAVEQALASPLFDGINLTNTDRVLVLFSAAEGSFKLSDSKSAMDAIRASASPEAHVIYGTTYDDELGDAIRVTVIATGLTR